jgi:hypothetical protein
MNIKNNTFRLSVYAALCILLLFTACGINPLSGNSSETTNELTVMAKKDGIEGLAPPYASLYLIKDTYDPLSGEPFDSITTDTAGIFRFTTENGGYNLFCRQSDSLQAYVHLQIGGTLPNNDTLRETLFPPGSMEGYAPRDDDSLVTSYLFLEGTPFFTIADRSSGYFRIDNIPRGRYTARQYSLKSAEIIITPITDTLSSESSTIIDIVSDSVVTLPWRH